MDAWFDRLQKEIEEATAGLRDADWGRAPEGRWNSAQILEHLGRSYGTTAKMLELSLGAGGPPQVRSARVRALEEDIGCGSGNFSQRDKITTDGDSQRR